jgi:hypothetical protein
MITSILAAALVAASPVSPSASPSVSPSSEPQSLSQSHRALLRCSAAFALVSHQQAAGDAQARKWPDLGERGREFFVRALAQLMDETGMDRETIAAAARAEAGELATRGDTGKVMPGCLMMLEASGV